MWGSIMKLYHLYCLKAPVFLLTYALGSGDYAFLFAGVLSAVAAVALVWANE
jgi:hypothetical protein